MSSLFSCGCLLIAKFFSRATPTVSFGCHHPLSPCYHSIKIKITVKILQVCLKTRKGKSRDSQIKAGGQGVLTCGRGSQTGVKEGVGQEC